MRRIMILAIANLCLSTTAQAVEITGGDLSLGYSAFTDNNDVAKTAISGSVEIGFSREFSLQIDAANHHLDLLDENGTNFGLHGIYHADDTLSFGAFLGRDEIGSLAQDYYGVEIGKEFGNFDAEGYVGYGETYDVGTTRYGVRGLYSLNDAFDLTASVDRADFEGGLDLTRTAIGVTYNVSPQFSVYGEVGSARLGVLNYSSSESFVGVGASIEFGADRGATFGRRSLLNLVPGL